MSHVPPLHLCLGPWSLFHLSPAFRTGPPHFWTGTPGFLCGAVCALEVSLVWPSLRTEFSLLSTCTVSSVRWGRWSRWCRSHSVDSTALELVCVACLLASSVTALSLLRLLFRCPGWLFPPLFVTWGGRHFLMIPCFALWSVGPLSAMLVHLGALLLEACFSSSMFFETHHSSLFMGSLCVFLRS